LSYVFTLPSKNNIKLAQVMQKIREDKKLQSYWRCSNVMAIDRMGYTDHGPTHVKIVANIALKLLRTLVSKQLIKPSIVENYGLTNDDAEVVVVLGSVLHDLGMVVQRQEHQVFSATLAIGFIERLCAGIYGEEEIAIITSEVLHAITSHEVPSKILTKEAGIVTIADALDMEAGRARIPFQAGKIDIHAISALSIKKIEVEEETEKGKKPINIKITMSNSAGIFQIDELLKPRIINSGLQKFFHVEAQISGEKENKILAKFEF
jgi:uncharacterized protein